MCETAWNYYYKWECTQYSPSGASFLGVPSSGQDDPEIRTNELFNYRKLPVTNNLSLETGFNKFRQSQLIYNVSITLMIMEVFSFFFKD
jgi:hypothetical protein